MRYAKATTPEKQKQHAYTFRSDEKTLELLREESKRTRLSASEILRRLIRDHVEKR